MKFVNRNEFNQADHQITPETCLDERKQSNMPPIILDLREEAEYQEKHLVGSYSMPASVLKDNLLRIPPYARIILYGGGNDEETTDSVKMMVENKFSNVAFVTGGVDSILESLSASEDEVILANVPKENWGEKIESTLDNKVRPALAADGGGLEVVKIEEDKVYINYQGACNGCASAATGTLNFIRNALSTSLNHDIDVIMA
jgi:Fe-S cluster biogenesis protein NfuA/rhodanese-related sulfurtransferase